MSIIRADSIKNRAGNGAPDFPNGITVTGVITATSIGQTLNGDLTVTGDVGIAGTLTYEDVTNVDSVGLITARTGIKIGPAAGVAGTFFADGSYITAGIITATTFHGSGADLTGIDATKIQTGNTTVETTTSRIDNKVNNVGVLTVTASGAKVTGIVTVFGTGIDYTWQGGTSMAWWKSEDMVSTSSWPAAKGGSDANLISHNGGTNGLTYTASDSSFNNHKTLQMSGNAGGGLRTTNQTVNYWFDGDDAFTMIMALRKNGHNGGASYGDAAFVMNVSSSNATQSWAMGPFGDHTWGGSYGEMWGGIRDSWEGLESMFSYPWKGLFMVRMDANYDFGELSVNAGSGWKRLEMRHNGPGSLGTTFRELSIFTNAAGNSGHSFDGRIAEWAYWRNKRLAGVELECVTRHWCEKFQL